MGKAVHVIDKRKFDIKEAHAGQKQLSVFIERKSGKDVWKKCWIVLKTGTD